MALYSSVGCLVLKICRPEITSTEVIIAREPKAEDDHIAHHVAVIVLAGPDKAALGLHDPGYRIIDQGIEIGDAQPFQTSLIVSVVDLLENILEGMVIFLGDRILGGKPQILLRIQRILEAASGKALDGTVPGCACPE